MTLTQQEPWIVWRDAAKREAIDASIRQLYADMQVAIDERNPRCDASGRCCRFEEFGHRLYVTGLEIAWFLNSTQASGRTAPADRSTAVNDPAEIKSLLTLQQFSPATSSHHPAPQTLNCPYQIDGLCSTHDIRPLGCRVFFCEEGTEAWQQDTTEHFLNRLKQLHTDHGLPYAYMEWRAGLAEAGRVLHADDR